MLDLARFLRPTHQLPTHMQTARSLPDMLRFQRTDQYKFGVILVGLGCLLYSLATLPYSSLGVGLIALLAFAVIVAPRMTLSLPRSNFFLSFSDSVVFFAFLVYGGEIAIVVAFIETFANCYYLKRKGGLHYRWFQIFNSSLAALVATLVFVAYTLAGRIYASGAGLFDTRNLIIALGILSITHFLTSSFLVSVYRRIKSDEQTLWQIWKKECLSTSMAQLTGAGLAGVAFKLMNYADPIVIAGAEA